VVIKIAENRLGQTIEFHEEKHIYLTPDNIRFTSVSKCISDAFPVFETNKIAARVAMKEGVSVRSIKEKWEKSRNDGADLGTNVHLYAECLIKGITLPRAINKKARKYFKTVKTFIKNLKKEWDVVATELIVFDSDYKLAGTFDALLRHKGTSEYKIIDWKTNKEIKLHNNYQKGKGPLSHLDDCNYNKYGLQLNLYRHILLKGKYFPIEHYDMELLHITEDEVTGYPIDLLDAEIELLVTGAVK